jgi:hypothetical protein
LFVGLSYQYFNFDQIDGISLKNLPVTISQPDDSTTFQADASHPICSARSNTDTLRADGATAAFTSFGDCGYIRDLIETTNQIHLKVHQATTYVTFGITNRIDVSVAVPVENVRMSLSSTAIIIYNDDQTGKHFYAFNPARPDCINVRTRCLTSTFSSSANASGVGDITLRAKGTAWKGERMSVGLGVDLRLPTGDQQNFLGTGAAGIKPFAVWSYTARVSPHALVGYQANGSSVIGGDLNTGRKDRIPGAITYSGGADVWITKRLTAGFDLVGQYVPRAQIISINNPKFTDLGPCDTNNCAVAVPQPHSYDNLNVNTGSYNVLDGSAGVKVRLSTNLLLVGNALFKLNNQGLRAKTVPLIGISYTF